MKKHLHLMALTEVPYLAAPQFVAELEDIENVTIAFPQYDRLKHTWDFLIIVDTRDAAGTALLNLVVMQTPHTVFSKL